MGINMTWTYPCRTSATVSTMRSSTVAYAHFRQLQKEHIQANLARRAQEQGQEVVDLDSDAASEAAEEVEEDEYREHEERRLVTQLLQLVKPVQTR